MLSNREFGGKVALPPCRNIPESEAPPQLAEEIHRETDPRIGKKSPIIKVIEQYLAAYEEDDVQKRLNLFADGAIFEDPVGSRQIQGIDEINHFFRSSPPEMAVAAVTLLEVIECGSEALFKFDMIIRGWKDRAIKVQVYEAMAMDADGKILSLRAYWNEQSISDYFD